MQSVLRDEESLYRSFFAEGDAELAVFLDDLLALFYELWLIQFSKRMKNLAPSPKISAVEAIAFLTPQIRTLECKSTSPSRLTIKATSFPKASQKVSAILATLNSRFPQK